MTCSIGMVGHLLSEEYLGSPLRIEYEGAFYHVTARGNERERIFFGKGDYDKFKGAKGSGTHLLTYMEG